MAKNTNVGVTISAKDNASGVVGSLASKFEQFGSTAAKVFEGVSTKSVLAGASLVKVGQTAFSGMSNVYEQYAGLQQAQGEIASLDISDSGIKKITKAAQAFSNQWAGTTAPDFIKASYDIKSGISSLSDAGVAEFTKLAAMTGTATKASTATMTKLFALGHGIFSDDFTSDTQFGQQFSAAVASTVKMFRTDGADLSLGLSNVGAAAKAMGVSLSEELAILGMAKGAFNTAAEAGTGYRAFLNGVVNGQSKLGLAFTDSSGKLLPMVDILEKLKAKYGELSAAEIAEISSAMGGSEAGKFITALIDKTDDLRHSQEQLNHSMANGAVVTEAMAKKMQRGQAFNLMDQQLGNLTQSLGSMFAPAMESAATAIGSMAVIASNFINANQGLFEWLGTGIAVVTGLGVAIGGLKLASAGLTVAKNLLGLSMLKNNRLMSMGAIATKAYAAVTAGSAKAFAIAKTAMLAFGGAVKWVGRLMLTNPISLAITGIALAATAIITHWEPIKAFVSDWISSIAALIAPVVDWIGEKFGGLLRPIQVVGGVYIDVFKKIGQVAQQFFGWLGEKFAWVGSIASKVGSWFGSSHDEPAKSNVGDIAKKTIATSALTATLATPAFAAPVAANALEAPAVPTPATAQAPAAPSKHIVQNINIHLSVAGNPSDEALKDKIAEIARVTFAEIRQDEEQRRW